MKPPALWQTKHIPVTQMAKSLTPPALWGLAYRLLVTRGVADASRYGMVYQPWREPGAEALYRRVASRTLVGPEGCWHLASRLKQSLAVPGVVYELGVYKGGTARLLREGLDGAARTLRLFDTFAGMEQTSAEDRHRVGDFADTSRDAVRAFVGPDSWIDYRAGWVPETFAGVEGDVIAFAHVDLDLHDPIRAACEFIYPRLSPGGAMVFDDYGYPSTPGARRAVDGFFAQRAETPIILQTGQAIVIKL